MLAKNKTSVTVEPPTKSYRPRIVLSKHVIKECATKRESSSQGHDTLCTAAPVYSQYNKGLRFFFIFWLTYPIGLMVTSTSAELLSSIPR